MNFALVWSDIENTYHFRDSLDTTHFAHDIANTTIHIGGDMATSIRLSEETEQRLNFLVARTGRTKAFYLREIIEAGINDMEDYYLASDVLERIRKGHEKVHSADDVRADLGLDD